MLLHCFQEPLLFGHIANLNTDRPHPDAVQAVILTECQVGLPLDVVFHGLKVLLTVRDLLDNVFSPTQLLVLLIEVPFAEASAAAGESFS